MVSKAILKTIRSLKLKKYRAKERKFLVEGFKSVQEVLNSDMKVEAIYATDRIKGQLITEQVIWVDQEMLNNMSTLSSNETCLAVVSMPEEQIDFVPSTDRITLVLDGINDPGNLGTIVRTLDWFGYDQVVCSEDSVDFFNPKSIVASMGSFTRVKPYYANIEELLKAHSLPVYGMEMNGQSLVTATIEPPAFVVMGSESHGIRKPVADFLDHSITIDRKGKAESLNVGLATGILLYELSR
jgi:TrmH family RNA methyltransferase